MSAILAVLVHLALLLLLPPLMLGVIGRVKARAAGRRGQGVLQPYFDLARLLRKGAVIGTPTSWVFAAGPIVSLASVLVAGLLVPLAAGGAPLSFGGDVFAFIALLALGRFFTMAAALDTGSAFEGMGASREAAFAALAEPALILALAIVCIPAGSASFAAAFGGTPTIWSLSHPAYLIAAVALFVVLLAENSRIPVDDPATHLELTMIHEVMVLDHSGPDFALIQYGAAMKLFVTGALVVHLLLPIDAGWGALALFVAGEIAVAVMVGVVESTIARLRLSRVSGFLVGAAALAAVGVAVMLARGTP